LNKEQLPGPEALFQEGKKDQQVIMIRNNDKVEAYQWISAERRWDKVGEVVDAVGESRKQLFEGIEYDHVFRVDLDGKHMQLPYNVTGTVQD
jgi:phospholipase A-2-activating protein